MFRLKYLGQNLLIALRLLAQGHWRRLFLAVYARAYLGFHNLLFPFQVARRASPRSSPSRAPGLEVQTQHPVAFASPDHQVPHGTRYNNSTNRKFVLLLHDHCRAHASSGPLCFMDLGCSGGQLVADFTRLGWIAAGLEGSDHSLKHRRANWAALAGTQLFTCDIARPYQVLLQGQPYQCHLITAWEVLEHIPLPDLDQTFRNIARHLRPGGLFIASTSSSHSIVDGIELHQTRMPNAEWRAYLSARFPELEPVDLGLKTYQYVRFDFGEESFLVYRKRVECPAKN